MSWVRIKNGEGQSWAINADGLWLLAKAYARAKYIWSSALTVPHDEDLGFLVKLRVQELQVPWGKVELAAQTDAHSFCRQDIFRRDRITDATITYLASIRRKTAYDIALFSAKMKLVNEENASAYEKLDHNLEAWMKGIKIARDVDLQALLVVAGFASGGVAWTALGAGSVGAGVFEYQDTHNLGGAITKAAGTFVVGAIPFAGKALGGSVKVLGSAVPKQVIVVGATGVGTGLNDLSVSWVEGKTAGVGVKSALVDAGLTMALGPLGDRIDKLALPIKTTLDTGIAYGTGQIADLAGEAGQDDFGHTKPTPLVKNSTLCPIAARAPQDDRRYIVENVLRRVA